MSHAPAAQPPAGSPAAVELPPDLPMAVFTSTERWHPERIGALALYCSDGRWGDAFDEFCHRHLLIPRYDRWAVPGGPAWLAPVAGEDDLGRAAREQLDFLMEVHQLERIVLIAHFGCAFYGRRVGQGPRECLPAQRADLRAASAVLRRRYRGVRVESYLAMLEGNSLVFRQDDG
jgi:hypothetical protein